MSANSRLSRVNLTRTTWVVEMCRPGYRACAADSHDHKHDPTKCFVLAIQAEARSRQDMRERGTETLRSAASHSSCCKSRLHTPSAEKIGDLDGRSLDGGSWGQAGSCFAAKHPPKLKYRYLCLALARIRRRPQRPQRLACTADHSAHRRNHVVLPHDITAVRPAAARPQNLPLIVTSRPSRVARLRLRDACPSSLSLSAKLAGQCRCMEPLKPTPNPQRLVPFSNPWPCAAPNGRVPVH